MHAFDYQVKLIVIGAQDIPNVSTIGKLDAFAKIEYDGTEFCTSVLHDCGINPIWNYVLSFNGNSPSIRIVIFDKRLLGDKYIGECTIDCSRIPHGDHCFQIPLTDHGKKYEKHGWLRVNISLIKSMSDYAHHPTPPVTYMIPQVPQVPQQQIETVHIQTPLGSSNRVPHPPVIQKPLLSERPDILRRGSYRRFHCPNSYDSSPRSRANVYHIPYPAPPEPINRRMNCKCYPILPPSAKY